MQWTVSITLPQTPHPRSLGVVEARTHAKAVTAAEARWPFAPVGTLHVESASAPTDHARGFDSPEVQRRAACAAQSPEAKAKRAATRRRLAEERRAVRMTMTMGQKKWHDLRARARKAKRPHRASDGTVG